MVTTRGAPPASGSASCTFSGTPSAAGTRTGKSAALLASSSAAVRTLGSGLGVAGSEPGHRHTRDLLAGRRGNVHAFVHVLHLQQRWAYCLDLPHPFGEGPAESHAIAVDPAGRRLAVADLASGSLAYADTHRLAVTSVIAAPKGDGPAAVDLDASRTFLGAGRTVTLLEGGTTSRWPVPSALRGLHLNPGGGLLYAGGTDEIVWLDATSGTVRDRVGVPGLTDLRHVIGRG